MKLSILLVAFLLLIPCGAAHAQATNGDDLEVYVITMSPGEAPWERFGHNALGIRDRTTGVNAAYNWGLFDFADPVGFVGKFLKGDLVYWADAFDADAMAQAYLNSGRTVSVQYLDLTAEQKLALRDRLAPITPANSKYDYDYYLANCSTKVRDALDETAGGQIKRQLEPIGDRGTYRWHTRRLSADAAYLYTALHVIMGQPIDRPINAWEESFLPERFRDHLRNVKLTRPDGSTVPIVLREITLRPSVPGPVARATPPNWTVQYLLFTGAVAGLMLWLGRRDARGWMRYGFAAIAVVWSVIGGGGGLIGLWGWFFTRHWVAKYNENLLQINPLLLGFVVLVPLVVRKRPLGAKPARALAVAVAVCSVVGVLMQVLPMMDQVNGEMLAFTVLLNLGLAATVLRLTRPAKATDPVAATPTAEVPAGV